MSWTADYPTKPGFYWIRNYRHYGKGYDGPIIIEVVQEKCTFSGDPDLRFYFCGDEMLYRLTTLDSAEWQGPIKPESEKRNRPEFKRDYFPPLNCAKCLKPAHEVISWPVGVVNAQQLFGFICRQCWIETLTPEQREAYRV